MILQYSGLFQFCVLCQALWFSGCMESALGMAHLVHNSQWTAAEATCMLLLVMRDIGQCELVGVNLQVNCIKKGKRGCDFVLAFDIVS